MARFLSYKAALLENHSVELALNFQIATATVLTHLGTNQHASSRNYQLIAFPLSKDAPECLQNIPEFIIENVVDFTAFLRRFQDEMFQVELNVKLLSSSHV